MSEIKRVVNGNFEEPESTRDILGLSGKHFSALIVALQHSVAGYLNMQQMTLNDFITNMVKYIPELANLSEQELKNYFESEKEHGRLLLEILEAINQPYDGAIYTAPNGSKFIIKEGKEIHLSKIQGQA